MLKQILEIEGAKQLDTKKQKYVIGGGNCRLCYLYNGGAYNVNDPNCQGCGLPEPL